MHKKALFRLHFIVFLWGFTAILGKLITVNSSVLVFYRMLFATFFLCLYLVFFQKETLKISKKLFFQLLGIGGFMAIHWYCFFYSIKISNVSIALSCLSLSTLFAALLEPLFFKRKIDYLEVAIGLVIVFCILFIFNVEFRFKKGIFYGILTALFGTLFSVLNGKMYGKTTSGKIIFYEIFGGWILFALFSLGFNGFSDLFNISLKNLGLVILLSSIFTAFPMLESVKLMKYISPYTLILAVNLEPIYGILLAYFVFGKSEHMSWVFYLASAIMILSIFVNGIIKSKRAKNLEIKNT